MTRRKERREERQEDRQLGTIRGGGNLYQMRQKLVSIGDDFWIENDQGQKTFKVDGKALRGSILQVFDQTFAITSVLLLIALINAALGIATTLAVLVLERTHQLNTLYAVGASFRQIRTMIFWESVLMVIAGELAGVLCGFILSYLLVFVINRQSFGWTFLYGVDLKALALSLPLIVLTALLAALPAIRLVFREPPATLLRDR